MIFTIGIDTVKYFNLFFLIAILLLNYNSISFATENSKAELNRFENALNEFQTVVRYNSVTEARQDLTKGPRNGNQQLPKIVFIGDIFYLYYFEQTRLRRSEINAGRFLDEGSNKFDFFSGDFFQTDMPIFYDSFLSLHKNEIPIIQRIIHNYFSNKSDVNYYLVDFFMHVLLDDSYSNMLANSSFEDEFYYFLAFSSKNKENFNSIILNIKNHENQFNNFNVDYLLKILIKNSFFNNISDLAYNYADLLFSSLLKTSNNNQVSNQISLIETFIHDDLNKLRFLISLKKSINTSNSNDFLLRIAEEKIESLILPAWKASPERVQAFLRTKDNLIDSLFAAIFKKVEPASLIRYVDSERQLKKKDFYSPADIAVLEKLLEAGCSADAEILLTTRHPSSPGLEETKAFFSSLNDTAGFLKSVAQLPENDALHIVREFFCVADKSLPELLSSVDSQELSEVKSVHANRKLVQTYKDSFKDLHDMRFSSYHLANTERELPIFDDVPLMIIYNNDNFSQDDYPEYIKGKKLEYDENTPIGYNIYLPQHSQTGSIKEILFSVYGGGSPIKEKIKYLTRTPTKLAYKRLLQENVAIVELNLVDLQFDFNQHDTPEFLHERIHQSIDYIFRIFKEEPERIHNNLTEALSPEWRAFLFGASFGGGVSFRHAQMYPKTFAGYISHGGQFCKSKAKGYLSKFRVVDTKTNWLDVAAPSHFSTLEDPLLILQNSDDNCVPEELAYFCYRQAVKQAKAHLIRLFVTPISNEIPQKLLYRGHYTTGHPVLLQRYIDHMVGFIKHDNHKVHTAFSAWSAYENKTKAYKRNGAEIDGPHLFAGHALDIHIENAHRHDEVFNDEIWQEFYAPSQKIIAFIERLKSDRAMMKQEATRFKDQLTLDNVRSVFQHYLPLVTDYLRFTMRLTKQETEQAIAHNEAHLLQILKEKVLLYLQDDWQDDFHDDWQDDERVVHIENILFYIYKNNYNMFTASFEEASHKQNFINDMNKMKEYFLKVLNKRKEHISRCVDDLISFHETM